jgi:hypothetical protein
MPTASWQPLDGGGTLLSAFAACYAPGITSVTLSTPSGDGPISAILAEWSGVAPGCNPQVQIGSVCPTTSTWQAGLLSDALRGPQLVVAVGMAETADPQLWTANQPLELYERGSDPASTLGTFLAGGIESAALPSGSGMVGPYQTACYSDLFAFQLQTP